MKLTFAEQVRKNPLVVSVYKAKTYFDIGMGRIGWVSGKLPEIMGFIYILEKFGIVLIPSSIVFIVCLTFLAVAFLGVFYRKAGLWFQERIVETERDPIKYEMYLMSKRWNEIYEKQNNLKR